MISRHSLSNVPLHKILPKKGVSLVFALCIYGLHAIVSAFLIFQILTFTSTLPLIANESAYKNFMALTGLGSTGLLSSIALLLILTKYGMFRKGMRRFLLITAVVYIAQAAGTVVLVDNNFGKLGIGESAGGFLVVAISLLSFLGTVMSISYQQRLNDSISGGNP